MEKGILYLVATPIGNLGDITLRAIETLKNVDIVAAEDTRRTLQLLNHLEISKPLVSCYRHNEAQKGEYIIGKLLQGESVAIVSDAGTPAISDPGEEIVKNAIENGITISPIPGPVAGISALIVSGISTGRFTFEGFIPVNKRLRKERLSELVNEHRTMIFYEAPHKLIYTLKDMCTFFGEDRKVSIARELTKKFEEIRRGTLGEHYKYYSENTPKGEFVLIVEGTQKSQNDNAEDFSLSIKETVLKFMEEGLDKKEAMKKTALLRNISKKEVYSEMLK